MHGVPGGRRGATSWSAEPPLRGFALPKVEHEEWRLDGIFPRRPGRTLERVLESSGCSQRRGVSSREFGTPVLGQVAEVLESAIPSWVPDPRRLGIDLVQALRARSQKWVPKSRENSEFGAQEVLRSSQIASEAIQARLSAEEKAQQSREVVFGSVEALGKEDEARAILEERNTTVFSWFSQHLEITRFSSSML